MKKRWMIAGGVCVCVLLGLTGVRAAENADAARVPGANVRLPEMKFAEPVLAHPLSKPAAPAETPHRVEKPGVEDGLGTSGFALPEEPPALPDTLSIGSLEDAGLDATPDYLETAPGRSMMDPALEIPPLSDEMDLSGPPETDSPLRAPEMPDTDMPFNYPETDAPLPPVRPVTPVAPAVPDKLPAAEPKKPVDAKSPEDLSAQSAAARELLARVTAVPPATLENVQQVTLDEFLSRISGGDDALRAALRAYWEAAGSAGAYAHWKNQAAFLENQASGGYGTAPSVEMQAALVAARTAADDALATLRADAVRLGEMAGYSREIWPADMPHAGAYNTQYEKIAEMDAGAPRLELLDRIVDLRWQQWLAAGAAYRAAEYVRQEIAKSGTPGAVLQTSWAVEQRREMLFKSLVQYNMDILDYVLAVSHKRGGQLAPLLVVPKKPEEAEAPGAAVVPEAARPITPRTSVLDPESMPSRDTETLSRPRLPAGGALEEEATRVYTGDTVRDEDVPGFDPGIIGGGGIGLPLEEMEEIEEFAPVETPPRGSGYERIGGETGSTSTMPAPPRELGVPRTSYKPVLQPYTSAKIPLSASLETLNSRKVQPGRRLSLEEVFRRVAPQRREQAAKDYWRYVVLQAQGVVLDYQAEILAELGREQLAQPDSPADALSGLQLTAAVEALNAQRLALEADAFGVLARLNDVQALRPTEIQALPLAVSRPNTGSYDLRLDEFPAGSPRHERALQLARHLDFCVALCAEADGKLASLGLLVPPGADDGRMPAVAPKDFPAFFSAMENARAATRNYLRLVYTLNSALVSGTFLSDSAMHSHPADLSRRLCGREQ